MEEEPHITILEDNTDVILSMREGIASLLPSLWLSLDPVFGLEEETESSTWCTYNEEGKLLLYSVINLKVKNQEKTRSITSIKKALLESGIEGLLWVSPLNTYSVMVASSASDFGSIAVELFTHADISYLFIRLYVHLNLVVGKFDEQVMSNAYFDFISKHGLLSMTKGIVKVNTDKVITEGGKVPDLYGGLYDK